MLNADQLKQFKFDGYTIFEGGFNATKIIELKNIFEKSKSEIQNYSGWAFMGMFRHSQIYLKFIAECGALSVARQLTGNYDVDLYWDSVVIKTAKNQKQFCWHQDEGYTETSPREYYTFWIPLQDVNAENGGLWVLPGSHKNGILKHSPVKTSETKYPGQEITELDTNGELSISMKVGQILVFSSLLIHRSGGNSSLDDRLALAFAIHTHGFREINVPANLNPVSGLQL